jgi:hypothetical protein
MAKFSIAPKPTFTVDVAIPQVGEKPAMVPFTFKYRDRTALAELFDSWKAKTEAIGERFKGTEPTLAEITAAEVEQGVDQIKDLVVSWGFGDKLNDESITALVKSCIGVSDAIVKAYSEAFGKARLGN